jgi:hypothetical protein
MHNRPAEKSMAGRLPRPTVGTLALLPVHGSEEFRRSQKWERNTYHFGGPADSGSPVALRPPLAGGMPFRLLYMTTMAGFLAYVNETGIELSPSESFQPGCHRPVTQLSGGIVGPVRSPGLLRSPWRAGNSVATTNSWVSQSHCERKIRCLQRARHHRDSGVSQSGHAAGRGAAPSVNYDGDVARFAEWPIGTGLKGRRLTRHWKRRSFAPPDSLACHQTASRPYDQSPLPDFR